jgi:ADP-ribose pyrophosphatase YjhB (NUDIX family)
VTNEDDAARIAWLAEGNMKQARKRVAVKALIRDDAGRFLLVNPTYKEYWDLPGGMVEANEPPATALTREVAEELDVRVAVGPVLALDWVGPHGPWDDQLVFVFEATILSSDIAGSLRIADSELSDFGFFSLPDARRLLRNDVAARLDRAAWALQGPDRVRYAEIHTENGRD